METINELGIVIISLLSPLVMCGVLYVVLSIAGKLEKLGSRNRREAGAVSGGKAFAAGH